jgi:transaldolase/glucose-6-phosphate isomerase
MRLTTRLDGVGAEFFRWEFATAVAGAALGINPFDEPNVAEAKEKTKALLEAYEKDGRLPETEPRVQDDDVALHTRAFSGGTPAAVVRTAIEALQPGDYVAFLSYLPADASIERAVSEARQAIRRRIRAAGTFGVGPRYLHSTGQYHKGGPNTPLAFVITADDETETDIAEARYSFSVLKRAQALGDFQTLEAHGRRVIRIHVKSADAAGALERLFASALAAE